MSPLVAGYVSSPQSYGVARTKLRAPRSDRLVRDGYAPIGQELLDIAQAQAEAEVEPHGVADDFGRVAIAGMTAARIERRLTRRHPTRHLASLKVARGDPRLSRRAARTCRLARR